LPHLGNKNRRISSKFKNKYKLINKINLL